MAEETTNLPAPARLTREIIPVTSKVAVFDTGAFDHILRIAKGMATASLLPDVLTKIKVPGKQDPEWLPAEAILGNCIVITEQAWRWDVSPFMLMNEVAFVYGKAVWSGKLIAAIIEGKCGSLDYEFFGTPGAEDFGVIVKGKRPSDGKEKEESGTVADWATRKNGSLLDQWKGVSNQRRMLRYRGAREWARFHAPQIMLGVFSDDEMTPAYEIGRTIMHDPQAVDSGPSLEERLSRGKAIAEAKAQEGAAAARGFDHERVQKDAEQAAPGRRRKAAAEKLAAQEVKPVEEKPIEEKPVAPASEEEVVKATGEQEAAVEDPAEGEDLDATLSESGEQDDPAADAQADDEAEGEVGGEEVEQDRQPPSDNRDDDFPGDIGRAPVEQQPVMSKVRELGEAYNKALWMAGNEAGLKKKGNTFWDQHGPKPEKGTPEAQICARIGAVHLERFSGSVTGAEATAKINDILAEF